MSRSFFIPLSLFVVALIGALVGCEPSAGAIDAQGKGISPPKPYTELTKEEKIARMKSTPMSDAAKQSAIDAIEKGTDK